MSTTTTSIIELSPLALAELAKLDVSKENFLRLWVVSGGCQGLSYQAGIDNQLEPSDQVIYEDDSIRVVTDADSVSYLPGLVIDYSDDLAQSGFRFQNPNAKQSCGCGSSFCAN